MFRFFNSLEWYDPPVDGYQANFRYYIPRLGRWLSPDPMAGDIANPQSLNRYSYVLNGPTTNTDPAGLTCFWFEHCGGAAFPGEAYSGFGSNWNEFDLLQIQSGWTFEYQGTIQLPQTVGPEGTLYGGYDVDVWFAYPQYGVLWNPTVPGGAGVAALQQIAQRANAIVVRTSPQPEDVNACRQTFLMNNGGPGAQALVNNWSLFSYIPASGGISGALSTPAAKNSLELLAVKGGILAGGYAAVYLFDLPLLQSAASGAAQFLGEGAALVTGTATVIDARARYACGD